MSKIGKALLSLILDKKARDALDVAAQQPKTALTPQPTAQPTAPPQPQPSLNEQLHAKLTAAQSQPRSNLAPNRQQLIQNAMRVRSTKQDVLQELSQEQRLKLQVMAMKAMLPKNQGR